MAQQTGFVREIPGIYDFLKRANKLGPEFNKELRASSIAIAKHVVAKAQAAASTQQERLVAGALVAKSDRIPTINVKSDRRFVSASRPNRKRKTKVFAIDVWYGIEFGGGKHGKGFPAPRKTYADGSTRGGKHAFTSQFRPHKGRTGYFFYPTVRDESANIDKMYAQAVDRALKQLED